MARVRSPNRDKAFEIYKELNGNIANREIAKILDISEKTLSGWKAKDKWNEKINGVLQKEIRSTSKEVKVEIKTKAKKIAGKIVEDENSELTEKQRLFCIYYVKNKNATLAAIKAGYSKDSAYVEGSRLLRNAKVVDEIKKLKLAISEELLIDEIDIINEYIKIAFADIGDYVEFGTEEVETEFGMVNKSYVRFKQDMEVDSSIISEVSIGKDGAKLKLHDKMKALEFIYDKVSTDKVEKQKLLIEKLKLEISNIKGDSKDNSTENWVNAIKELAEKRKLERGNVNG